MKMHELQLNEDSKQIILNDKGQIHFNKTFKVIKKIAPIMKQAGMDVTPANIARVLGQDPTKIEEVVGNGIRKGKLKNDMFGPATGSDVASRVLLDLVYSKISGDGMGMDRTTQRTGLTSDEIQDMLDTKWVELRDQVEDLGMGIKFNPNAWFGIKEKEDHEFDAEEHKSIKNKDDRHESIISKIYAAAKAMTNNFNPQYVGDITGQSIADKTGIGHRSTVTRMIRSNRNDERMRQVERFIKRELS